MQSTVTKRIWPVIYLSCGFSVQRSDTFVHYDKKAGKQPVKCKVSKKSRIRTIILHYIALFANFTDSPPSVVLYPIGTSRPPDKRTKINV